MSIEPSQAPDRGRAPRARPRRAVAAAALLVALAGCGGGDDDDAAAAEATALAGSSWTLATASALDGKEIPAVETATLAFDDDGTTLVGSTGCNQFSGTYTQSGDALTIAVGPVTRAGCPGPEATEQEAAILAQLPEVASFGIDLQLELRNGDGVTLLVYDEGRSSVTGTSWTATGVNNGRDAVESTAGTEALTAEFGADGSLSGFAGCNTFTAEYVVAGTDELSITEVATTMKACDEAATTLEAQYLAALGNVATYELSGDTLTLRDSAGSTQVTYTIAA